MAMSERRYLFKFQIIDAADGTVIEMDFTTMTAINEAGICDSIHIHVSKMLRNWNRFARAEYEKAEGIAA